MQSIATIYFALIINCQSEAIEEDETRCMIAFDLGICLRPTTTSHSKDGSNISATLPPTPRVPNCRNSSSKPRVCRKHYIISSLRLEPYTEELVVDSLKTCCGDCVKYTIGPTFNSVTHIPSPDDAPFHFLFPVLGRTTYRTMYGFHFIPLIETPSIYYVTLKREGRMLRLINECLQMWPLLVNCLLMVVISGKLTKQKTYG